MNLQHIKIIAERKRMEFKALASAIGMSEGNLHRCVRENKIQAQDLEKIASVLNVSIIEFFDEKVTSIHTEGNYSPVADRGNISMVMGDAVLMEENKHLKAMVQEKEERIKDLKERIQELKEK